MQNKVGVEILKRTKQLLHKTLGISLRERLGHRIEQCCKVVLHKLEDEAETAGLLAYDDLVQTDDVWVRERLQDRDLCRKGSDVPSTSRVPLSAVIGIPSFSFSIRIFFTATISSLARSFMASGSFQQRSKECTYKQHHMFPRQACSPVERRLQIDRCQVTQPALVSEEAIVP